MLKRCTQDTTFAAVLGKLFSAARLVVEKGFHSDGKKWFCIVVIGTINICIG